MQAMRVVSASGGVMRGQLRQLRQLRQLSSGAGHDRNAPPVERLSHFIADGPVHSLHLEEWSQGETTPRDAPAVLLLHGAIGNGRIFASKRGDKGLAIFLARHGYRTFVADLRGRGQSVPNLKVRRVPWCTVVSCGSCPAVPTCVAACAASTS